MRTIADYFRLNPDAASQFRYVRSLYSSLVEIFGDPDRVIPIPSRIRFTGSTNQVFGFPVVANAKLRQAIAAYAEEETRYLAKHIQKARTRDPALKIEAGPRIETRSAYEKLLGQVLEGSIIHGASYRAPELFWIYHSSDIALAVALSDRAVASVDPALVATDGVHIKYRLLRIITGLILDLIHATNARIALDASFDQSATAPPVVQMLMRNTLLLSNIPGPLTLDDVDGYLSGVVRADPLRFHRELDALRQHLFKECRADSRLLETIRATHPEVKTVNDVIADNVILDERIDQFVSLQKSSAGAHQWVLGILAQLRPRFIEYEIVHHLRTLVLECVRKSEDTGGIPAEKIVLEADPAQQVDTSDTTVFDFNRPTIVDNRLERFGLVYDINNFTATYTDIIRQHSSLKERQSVRQMYAFQQVISGLSDRFGIRFEKFLGDGSFFTSRRAVDLVNAAAIIQDAYAKARRNGFVFDRGIRIALNHNHYYVIPLQFDGSSGSWTHDYLGSGLIELTRLTTGKTLTNLPELKSWLVSAGYTPEAVDAFLDRTGTENTAGASRPPAGETREFWVEVSAKGELKNEGVALTTGFLERLAQETSRYPLLAVNYGGHEWIGFKSPDISRYVMFRLAGVARLKGLEPMPVVEMAALEPDHAGQLFQITKPRVRGNLHDLVTGTEKAEEILPEAEIAPDTGPVTEANLPETTLCYFPYRPENGGGLQYYLGRVAPDRKGLVNALSTPHDLSRMDPKRLLTFYTSFEQNPDQEKETVRFDRYPEAALNIQAVPQAG